MKSEPPEQPPLEPPRQIVKKPLLGTLLVVTLVSVSYRLLIGTDWATSSALYIGVPALLAVGLSFIPTPRSVTGNILFWITLFLLSIGVLAIEGLVCILVALPFFLAIGFVVGIFIDISNARRKTREGGPWKTQCSFLVVGGFLSLEGTHENLSFNRHEVVVVERLVALSSLEFEERLARGPQFDEVPLPFLLVNTFPSPTTCAGTDGINLGSRWEIAFDHGEPDPRSLSVQVVESSDHSMTMIPIQDETEYAHWLSWKKIAWEWEENGLGNTEVKLTFEFKRKLDPAWYFGPLERRGVEKAGQLFLDALLVP